MKALHILLFLTIFDCVNAQKKIEFVKAVAIDFPYLGQELKYGCEVDVKEIIEKGEQLSLYGHFYCHDIDTVSIYKVYRNTQVYMIPGKYVSIKPEQDEYLKSLDSIDQKAMEEKIYQIAEKQANEAKAKVTALVDKFSQKGKQNGLLIRSANAFDQSEYTKGTGYSVIVLNLSSKTVKYIWFTIKGINPVGDLVATKTVKGVGPIKTNTEGEYNFDYVWLSDLVETTKLLSIKVQYMDGSIKTIQNASELIVGDKLYEFMFDDNE